MKTVLFLFLIYTITIHAEEEGCTISFFKKEEPCSTKTKKITIEPIVIKTPPKKELDNSKEAELKLKKILNDVTEYKNQNQMKTKKLEEELKAMKKEFLEYKHQENKKLKQLEKELHLNKNKIRSTKKLLIKTQKKLKKKKVIVKTIVKIIEPTVVKETPTVIHKVIRKMDSLPIVHDMPWIEIVVQNNMNIYELAQKYYGNTEAYRKIYNANKDIIATDLKIYDGMFLLIPMTETFEEQPILLNTY